MHLATRFLILPIAALLMSAVSPAQVIPLPNEDAAGEALVIPSDSPVRFRGWNKYQYAQFDGQFILTGWFMYGCGEGDCEGAGPFKDSELTISVVPDPTLAARLPNWKIRHNDMLILISHSTSLARNLGTAAERRELLSGKRSYLSGRISIVVDHFETGIECDSANFEAHFVKVAEQPKIALEEFNGDYGCAAV